MIAMHIIRNALLTATILLSAAGCARREEEPLGEESPAPAAGSEAPASTAATQTAPAATSDFVQGPKIVAPIQVEVVLTPAARTELSAKSETIIVEAVYGGDPTPAAAAQVNEFGLVPLGKTEQPLPAAGGKAGFSEEEIDRKRLELIVGQPQVMFNVRSARKAVPKNLLSCELYWNSVQAASASPIQIPCRLLSEPPPPRPAASVANSSPAQVPPPQANRAANGTSVPASGSTGGAPTASGHTPATGAPPAPASGVPPRGDSVLGRPNNTSRPFSDRSPPNDRN